jgi:hypothetical protein
MANINRPTPPFKRSGTTITQRTANDNVSLGTGNVETTGRVGRDADNNVAWGTDDQLNIVIGGTTTEITGISTGSNENNTLVTEGYVDNAVAVIGARYYMLDDADATVPAYKQTSLTASADATANVSASANAETDTLIEEWISPSTMTFSTMISGLYDLNVFVARTAGNRNVYFYWEFYEYRTKNRCSFNSYCYST